MTELIADIALAELRRLLVEFHHPELSFEATHGRSATRADSLEWHRAQARRLLANAMVEQADLIVAALETFAEPVDFLLTADQSIEIEELPEGSVMTLGRGSGRSVIVMAPGQVSRLLQDLVLHLRSSPSA